MKKIWLVLCSLLFVVNAWGAMDGPGTELTSGNGKLSVGETGVCIIGNISPTGNEYLGGDMYISGTLNVSGVSDFGSISADGLCLRDDISLVDDLFVGDDIFGSGDFTINGSAAGGCSVFKCWADTGDTAVFHNLGVGNDLLVTGNVNTTEGLKLNNLFKFYSHPTYTHPTLRSETTNSATRLYLIPNGTAPAGLQAGIKMFGSDYSADNTNYTDFGIWMANDAIRLNSKAFGTGVNKDILFTTQDTTEIARFKADASGLFAVGGTVFKGWTTPFKTIQAGNYSFLAGRTDANSTALVGNAYYDGVWKRAYAGFANKLDLNTLGDYIFNTAITGNADSAITWLPKVTVLNDGDLVLSNGKDIRPSADSTSAINIAQADGTDWIIFDTTNRRLGIGTTGPGSNLHIDQSSATGAMPVLTLDQADVSEELIKLIGTSANGVLTQSIVEAADVGTATIAGYIEVYIQDDGNQIADGSYYLPFYSIVAP